MGRFEGPVTVEGIFGVTRTNYYAASLEVNSWFRKPKGIAGELPKLTEIIPANFLDSRNWGISESLVLAYENFKTPSSINILLGDNVLFEVRRHDNKTRPGKYPILR